MDRRGHPFYSKNSGEMLLAGGSKSGKWEHKTNSASNEFSSGSENYPVLRFQKSYIDEKYTLKDPRELDKFEIKENTADFKLTQTPISDASVIGRQPAGEAEKSSETAEPPLRSDLFALSSPSNSDIPTPNSVISEISSFQGERFSMIESDTKCTWNPPNVFTAEEESNTGNPSEPQFEQETGGEYSILPDARETRHSESDNSFGSAEFEVPEPMQDGFDLEYSFTQQPPSPTTSPIPPCSPPLRYSGDGGPEIESVGGPISVPPGCFDDIPSPQESEDERAELSNVFEDFVVL